MRVLLVDDYSQGHADAHVVAHAIDLLTAQGHEVDHLSIDTDDFAGFMTPDERRSYETEQPLLADATKDSAARLKQCDALLFCYPTTMFGVSPRLKSWIERVMVLGVAFEFDAKQRVRPGMRNVRRLGVITTSPHGRVATARARDLGRRTFMRTLRLNCHPLCRRTFMRLPANLPSAQATTQLSRRFRHW